MGRAGPRDEAREDRLRRFAAPRSPRQGPTVPRRRAFTDAFVASFTQTGLRSAILAALGRSSRLLGHGQPLPKGPTPLSYGSHLSLVRDAGRGCPCPIAGRSRMPSWHPLTQTGLRSAILAALGRSSRLLGHGQPRPVFYFTSLVSSASLKCETFEPWRALHAAQRALARCCPSRDATACGRCNPRRCWRPIWPAMAMEGIAGRAAGSSPLLPSALPDAGPCSRAGPNSSPRTPAGRRSGRRPRPPPPWAPSRSHPTGRP